MTHDHIRKEIHFLCYQIDQEVFLHTSSSSFKNLDSYFPAIFEVKARFNDKMFQCQRGKYFNLVMKMFLKSTFFSC